MKITECLSIQHGIFLEQLAFLEERKDSLPPAEGTGLKEIVFAIARAVEKHAEIEETYLFPELEKHFGKRRAPLDVMEFEHEEIQKILGALNGTDDPREIQVEAAKFLVFLRDHIAKEEHVLFPLAEEVLGEGTLEEIGRACGLLDEKGRARVYP